MFRKRTNAHDIGDAEVDTESSPTPVHFGTATTGTVRFEPTKLNQVWASFRKRLTPATHPSTTSESAHGSGLYAETDMFGYNEDSRRTGPSAGGHLPVETIDPMAAKNRNRRKGIGKLLGNGNNKTSRSGRPIDTLKRGMTSGQQSGSRYEGEDDEGPWEPVSSVVVDNDFEQVIPHAGRSDSGSTRTPGGGNSTVQKEGSSLFGPKSENLDDRVGGGGRRNSAVTEEGLTTAGKRSEGFERWIQHTRVYETLVLTVWPSIMYFFDAKYSDPQKENAFMKETWFRTKTGALACCAFFLISWALSVGLQPTYTPFVWIAYLAVGGFFTIPLVVLIAFDFPRRKNWIWQPMLLGASWVLADVVMIEAHSCGFFSLNNTCGTKNFINMLGFAFGQPVLALLAMRQNRFFAMIGAAQWMIVAGVLLMTQNNAPTLFYRNMVNFALFHAFIIGTSFLRERGDRHMFEMRQQLKMQFRATQSAQVMERKASDSKRRFVSYIFHEVRVPLNTALLAVQNLEGENVFRHVEAEQGEMVHGLVRSLTTMEKVLNDVLSFNRMEAGKFTQARKPFDFHKSINLVALSHRPQAHTSGIELLIDLDGDIDKVGGVFIGDEMRLRQITSNLVSNSIKFTEQGSVKIVTKLIYPRLGMTTSNDDLDGPLREATENLHRQQADEAETKETGRFSSDNDNLNLNEKAPQGRSSLDVEKGSIHLESLRHQNDPKAMAPSPEKGLRRAGSKMRSKAIVRVEIHDTGIGLKKDDLDDQRLFSPYVQTEIGRRQGGKGSGLGLALVRQIVRLSNGRLGVDSEYGKGSVFWFELPYALPPPPKLRGRDPATNSPLGKGTAILPNVHGIGIGAGGGVPGTIDEEPSTSGFAMVSPMMEEKDPLEAIEHRETVSHLSMYKQPRKRQQHEQEQEQEQERGPSGSSTREGTSTSTSMGSERPRMSETESTIPLLSQRNDSIPSTEQVIASTYPPPDSGSSTDSSFDHTEAAIVAMQNQQRRESEFDADLSSRRGSEQVHPPGSSHRGGGGVGGRGEASGDEDPPLCCFVVDDDKLTRMLMSRMLTRLGHQVTTAENGKMALDMIKDSHQGKPGIPKFDVCFLDNQMPFMSGVEVVRAVREMGNPLYVVGCTGNALREDQDEYLGSGADGIIPKPVHQKSVLEQIKLARRRIAGETQPKAIQSIY